MDTISLAFFVDDSKHIKLKCYKKKAIKKNVNFI